MPIAGGPVPGERATAAGYYGQPIVKPPVWTWQIGLYFFVGGTAGMSGVIALAALATGESAEFVRTTVAVAFAGALISPVLLIWDLGRPARFLNMLRVFKLRSAMSMGVWTLVVFSGFAGAAFVTVEACDFLVHAGVSAAVLRAGLVVFVTGVALSGSVLATYTGVLLGATVIPAWNAHHRMLPFHFGVVGLGSAAAVLELLGYRVSALHAVGVSVAAIESAVGVWLAFDRRAASTRPVHDGAANWMLHAAEILTGPIALLARLAGWIPVAAVSFLAGAILSRYGWLAAGRQSASSPPQI